MVIVVDQKKKNVTQSIYELTLSLDTLKKNRYDLVRKTLVINS